MKKGEKLAIYNRNMKVFPFIFVFLNTPMQFFIGVYIYYITNSYAIAGAVLGLGNIIKLSMEIPTGVISDRYLGRKGTEIIANILALLGQLSYVFAYFNWYLLFLGEFFLGTASSLYSGNTTSLLHDTLSVVGKEKDYHKSLAKYHSYRYIGWSISVLFAGIFAYYFNITYIMIVCFFSRFIRLIFSLFLKDVNACYKEERINLKEGWKHIKEAWKNIKTNKKLRWLAALSVFRKSVCETDQLNSMYYKQFLSFFSMAWLIAVSLMLSGFAAKYSEKIVNKFGLFRSFLYVRFISIPLQIIGLLMNVFISPFLVEAGEVLNPIETTSQTALLHKEFTNKQRATMESLIEIIGSICFAVFFFVVGVLADVFGLRIVFLIVVMSHFLIIPICYKAFSKKSQEI